MTNKQSFQFIVTRPANRANRLVDCLRQLSNPTVQLQIESCPLIQIADYSEDFTADLSNFDGVVFISGNAVDQASKQLSETEWKKLLSNRLYAIGQQTAAILQKDVKQLASEQSAAEHKVHFPEQMNSEGFLAMPELTELNGQNWLIVKGLGGREKLKLGLQAAGAKVDELPVYQRKLPDLTAQKQVISLSRNNPYWLVTSLQALNNLWRILEKKPNGCRIIVCSDRIAQQGQKLGFNIEAQAQDASDQQLTRCVENMLAKAEQNH